MRHQGASESHLQLSQQSVGSLVWKGLVDADDGRRELSVASSDLEFNTERPESALNPTQSCRT